MLNSLLTTHQSALMLGVTICIFVIVTGGTYAVCATFRARDNIRKRALAPVRVADDDVMSDKRSLRHDRLAGAHDLLSSLATYFVPGSKESVAGVKKSLQRAGFFQPSAVTWFYFIRITLALLFPFLFAISDQMIGFDLTMSRYMMGLIGSSIVGLFGPSLFLMHRIKKLKQQCRDGFPDFMDLMVVCAEAGISVDQAIGRVSRELTPTYPYLGSCLHLASLELRAGRSLTDVFRTLGDRMGIEEAHNLGSLLHQSEELGTSLSEALRVYSDEMRDKRMSRAEEKAHALPAKMSVPLTLFVFPTVLVVILLPVYVRVSLM